MKTNKINGFHQFGHDDDGSDLSSFNGFLNAILAHHRPPHAPSPPPHTPTLEFRSIDGSGNNLSNTKINSANTDFTRVGPAHFANDDGHTMIDGPNPRDISNILVAGHGDEPDPQGLSGMMYAWGQFIDHDLDLEKTGGGANISIPVAPDDPGLPPGTTEIPLTRAIIDPATGTHDHPGAAINTISGWMDASMVYGSGQTTANSLRTADGHMKTSAGNNLPINPNSGMFMAGDVRAAENPDLTALQTLFVREHNYQVDLAHQQHPAWTGDQLYQWARAIVSAEIEHITYDEFLPHLLGAGAISPYDGYDSTVNPTITEEFAGAAFRFGHSLVSSDIEGINEQGQTTSDQELKDVFFEPASAYVENGGATDGLLRHLGADVSNKFDVHIIDDLRNFLLDPPDVLDLAAINIQRGRDLGLGTLNETREALGLTPYTDFNQISSDPETAAALELAYGTVDKIDLWSGGLSEDPVGGAMIGETFERIIAMQFEALRDGDRLWYENQGFDAKTLAAIKNTTLGDIIERNTTTDHMQDDVFVYYNRHSGTQLGVAAENPDAPQLVIGSKGFDTLIGGPQGDLLVANTGGTQTMTGGAGADEFIFNHNMNGKITDFKPGTDKIVFDDAGHLDFHDVKIKADHGNTVVEANGDHIVLLNVNPLQLHPADFVFHT